METKLIGDACKIITGKLDSNHAVPNGAYPFYTCAANPDRIDHYTYDDDVVLVAGNNALGNFHVNRFKGKFNAYQRTYILTANNGFDIDFIYYALKLELKRLKEKSQGSQTKFLTMPILKGIHLRDLSFSHQQKIAAILSALDAKIDCNNRINTELEAMAKTLYDYWFVQFDFPDANGNPYKSSGGRMVYNPTLKREIPEGWESGNASSLFDFNPSTPLTMNKEASYLDMNSLPLSGFMTNAPERKQFSGGAKFRNGDVVVARITPCLENGKTALITLLRDDEVGFGSTEFIVIRGKYYPLSAFAAQLGRSSSFRQHAISNMTGTSGRKRIDANTLETFSLPLPPEGLLLRYENAVGPFLKRMTNNAKENEQLTQLRDWLLPMLMNGQVAVS